MRYLNVFLFSAVLMFSVPGYSQGWGDGPHKRMEQGNRVRHERIWQELNLSDKQKVELKELRKKHFDEKKNLAEKMRKFKNEMRVELEKESPNISKLRDYSKKIGALSEKISNQFVDHLIDIKKILTPEQYKKMLEFKKQMPKRKGGKHPQQSINR